MSELEDRPRLCPICLTDRPLSQHDRHMRDDHGFELVDTGPALRPKPKVDIHILAGQARVQAHQARIEYGLGNTGIAARIVADAVEAMAEILERLVEDS